MHPPCPSVPTSSEWISEVDLFSQGEKDLSRGNVREEDILGRIWRSLFSVNLPGRVERVLGKAIHANSIGKELWDPCLILDTNPRPAVILPAAELEKSVVGLEWSLVCSGEWS